MLASSETKFPANVDDSKVKFQRSTAEIIPNFMRAALDQV